MTHEEVLKLAKSVSNESSLPSNIGTIGGIILAIIFCIFFVIPQIRRRNELFKNEVFSEEEMKKSVYAFWISIITSPLMLIVTMFGLGSEMRSTPNSWQTRERMVSYVPGNIKIIVLILLVLSVIVCAILEPKKKPLKGKILATFLIIGINIFVGILIMSSN